MSENIFVISTFSKLEENKEINGANYGDIVTVGFRHSFEKALEVVETNMLDIHEGIYPYACIEEIPPQIYPDLASRQFFKFNSKKEGYERIEAPKFVKSAQIVCSIG